MGQRQIIRFFHVTLATLSARPFVRNNSNRNFGFHHVNSLIKSSVILRMRKTRWYCFSVFFNRDFSILKKMEFHQTVTASDDLIYYAKRRYDAKKIIVFLKKINEKKYSNESSMRHQRMQFDRQFCLHLSSSK